MTAQDREVLHAAFVAPPTDFQEDRPDPDKVLAALARTLGVPGRLAMSWARQEYWHEERAAAHANSWAARYYPGFPLGLEGFAKRYAGTRYDNREALAEGRELWYRALAPIALWEEIRVLLAARRRAQAAREAEIRSAA
jgi:hypothetical protein